MKEMIKRTAACLLFAGLAAGMLYGLTACYILNRHMAVIRRDVLSAGGEYR